VTTIGSAWIKFRGDTSSIEGDVEDAAEKAGEESGKRFADGWGDKIEGLKDKLPGGFIGVGALAAGAFTSAWGQHVSAGKLQAKLGLSASDAKDLASTAGKVYADNWGESLDEVNDAVATVKQGLGDLADQADLQSLTEKALAFQSTFGVETQESIKAVSQMLKTGLAKNADEAFDILTTGEQTGADKAEDLFDTFNEYGTQFRKLGIDGSTALGLINQGLSNGARDSDLVADAIKEFSIRAVDGSQTTAQGFQMIGLNAQQMSEQIAQGGPAAEKGLQTVLEKLRGIEDPAKRAQAATMLFGTQAEDLGAALFALDPATAAAGKGMDKLNGSSDRMKDAINSTANPLESMQRQVMGVVGSLAKYLVPIMGPASKLVGKAGPLLLILAGAYTAASLATKAFTAWQGIQAVLSGEQAAKTALQTTALVLQKGAVFAATAATRAWTVAQAAFNLVMSANPIILVTLAIAALVAGVIIAYNKFGWFRDGVHAAFGLITDAASAVAHFFTDTLPAAFEKVPQFLQRVAQQAWNLLKKWGPTALAILAPFIGLPLLIFQHWKQIKGWLSGIWDSVVGRFRSAKNTIVNFINGIPGAIRGAITAIGSIGGQMADRLWSGLHNIVTRVGNLGRDLYNMIAGSINSGLIDPIKNWKFTIGAFGIHHTFQPFGGIPEIPLFAKGGLTQGFTLAGIGDNPSGQEAVLPMDSTATVKLFADAFDLAAKRRGGSGGSDAALLAAVAQQQDAMLAHLADLTAAVKAVAERDLILQIDSREVARANNQGQLALGRLR
jgi:phage-related minor tail protein